MNLCHRCLLKLITKCHQTSAFATSCIYYSREMVLFKEDHKNLLKEQPKLDANLKSLRIAIIGAPNAGKSQLTNQLVAWKFAPVSSKVHTTRSKIVGVFTEEENQLIFMDTPGVIQPSSLRKHNLEKSLLVDPHAALFDSDIIAVVVDVSHIWHRMRLDKNVLLLLEYHKHKPSILILNKIDLLKSKRQLLDVTRRLTNGCINGLPYIKSTSHTKTADEIIDQYKAKYPSNKTEEKSSLRNESNFDSNEYMIYENDKYKNNIDTSYNVLDNDENKVLTSEDSSIHHADVRDDSGNCLNDLTNTYQHKDVENDSKDLTNRMDDSDIKITKSSDLYDAVKWNKYYLSLKKLKSNYSNGWPNFIEVFMVSALNGDGIFELKNYLTSNTFKSKWMFNSSVVTNVGPLELAKFCIREKLMEYVPNDVAHSVEIRKITWEISDENLLIARFDIICKRKRQASLIMGANGSTVQKISRDAKQSLMNAFRREMTLQLVIKYQEEKK